MVYTATQQLSLQLCLLFGSGQMMHSGVLGAVPKQH